MCTIQEISYNCGISVSDLIGPSRKEEICIARYTCWRCKYRNEKSSYIEIGKAFNRTSHATIINGIRAIDNLESTHDPKYINAISKHKCFCTNE
jgi:chromosomal replication initiation ATPase DnaA